MFFFPRFHPTNNDSMASGSTDGLVNVFDLSQGKVNKIRRTIFNYIIDSTGATGSAGIFVRIQASLFVGFRRPLQLSYFVLPWNQFARPCFICYTMIKDEDSKKTRFF